MKTMYHPSLPVTQDVADDQVDDWAEQGWLKNQPKSKASAADQASDDQKGSKA